MFIKREDLVDMLEVIDCENGYVDLDHLVECCNNLPSSGMSVWCMKCENNGECMTIDKPNCFQPRQADTPQTDCGKDINVRSKDEPQTIKVGMATDSVTGKVLGITADTDCAWK